MGFLPAVVIAVTTLMLALESTAAFLGQLNHIFVIGPQYEIFNGGDPGDAAGGRAAAARAFVGTLVRSVTMGAPEVPYCFRNRK